MSPPTTPSLSPGRGRSLGGLLCPAAPSDVCLQQGPIYIRPTREGVSTTLLHGRYDSHDGQSRDTPLLLAHFGRPLPPTHPHCFGHPNKHGGMHTALPWLYPGRALACQPAARGSNFNGPSRASSPRVRPRRQGRAGRAARFLRRSYPRPPRATSLAGPPTPSDTTSWARLGIEGVRGLGLNFKSGGIRRP